MLEQKTGDLPEWEKRSTSQEIAQEEISNEETLLMEALGDSMTYFHMVIIKSGFVASVTRNLNMKIKVPDKMAWKML